MIIYRSYGELPAMVVSSLIVMLIRFLELITDGIFQDGERNRKAGVFCKMR